jgi:hypothetical protein
MSDDFNSEESLPEISIEAYNKIDRWRIELDQTPKLNKRDVFERAAGDLFLEAEFENNLGAVRAIHDAVYVLGRDHAGLADDDIQFVMDGAQGQVEQLSNGQATFGDVPFDDDERPPANGPEDYGEAPPLRAIDLSSVPLAIAEWLERVLPEPDRLMGEWLTTTTRVLLNAPTGLGKTNFALALAAHIAAGVAFLHWSAHRPARVLFIDGEMSRRLLKRRAQDVCRRCGLVPENLFLLSHEDIEGFQPLNTPAGKAFIEQVIKKLGGIDLVIFDNVMALTAGNKSEEDGWGLVLPLITALTKAGTGQIWIHHTGHDKSRGYGTSTREWRMDTVIHLTEHRRADTDVSFTLEFQKARERTPETRRDFEDVTIALVNDEWAVEAPAIAAPGHLSPLGQKFLDALHNALAGETTTQRYGRRAVTLELWKAECFKIGILDRDKTPKQIGSVWSKYRLELIAANRVACDETMAWII